MNARLAPPARRMVAALAVAAVAFAVTACAAPAADPERAAANEQKRDELREMERRGQRNDDRPLPK